MPQIMPPHIGGPAPARTSAAGKLGPVHTNPGRVETATPSQTPAPYTNAFTYITNGQDTNTNPRKVYAGDRRWAKVTLMFTQGSGTVRWGTRSTFQTVSDINIAPSGGGQAVQLVQNVPQSVTIGKGTSIYVAGDAGLAVSVTIEPIPWLEELVAVTARIAQILDARLPR